MIYEFKVDGMKCMHCVSAVENALSDISGVNSMTVSLENASVKVECDDAVSIDVLKNAVEEIGFIAE